MAIETWYTMTEIMDLLGVSRSTVDGWRATDRCPTFIRLPSGGLRMSATELMVWMSGLELV